VDIADIVDVTLVLGDGIDVEVWTGMDVWLDSEPSLAPDGLLGMDEEAWPDVVVGPVDDCC
jgi:hypothetical protein